MTRTTPLRIGFLGIALSVLGGCAQSEFRAASFDKQLEELYWSVSKISEQPRWSEDLWHDVKTLADPEWGGQMAESFEMIGW